LAKGDDLLVARLSFETVNSALLDESVDVGGGGTQFCADLEEVGKLSDGLPILVRDLAFLPCVRQDDIFWNLVIEELTHLKRVDADEAHFVESGTRDGEDSRLSAAAIRA